MYHNLKQVQFMGNNNSYQRILNCRVSIRNVTGAILLCLGAAMSATAQDVRKCGSDLVAEQMRRSNPHFDEQLKASQQAMKQALDANASGSEAAKGAAVPYEINVVFHIVLNQAQIAQIGGAAGIQQRVISQLDQLNTDWNARNPDSVKIPVPFKPRYGNMNVKFSLATKTPSGQNTPGYEIVQTAKASFDVYSGTAGTTIGYADAKYVSSGGAAAWDPTRYYNVWIVNMTPVGVLGFATPPPHPPYNLFPTAEQGAVILYGAFGRRTSPSQYFTYNIAEKGRTLTHETGHFLNLFHTWGSNDSCSDDDNISDTPLQGKETPNSGPVFPVLDSCSPAYPGIMFMNFMDYAVDSAQSLFTKGQAAAVKLELEPGGLRHSLVTQTTSVAPVSLAQHFHIYPNPANDQVFVDIKYDGPVTVLLTEAMGKTIRTLTNAKGKQEIDLSGLATGVYYLLGYNEEGKLIATGKIIHE
jgi:hypothetical protein